MMGSSTRAPASNVGEQTVRLFALACRRSCSTLDAWAHQHGVQLQFSRPGKPVDNTFVEAFNCRLRDECLNQHWFLSLADAQRTIEQWRLGYNSARPHRGLAGRTPTQVAESFTLVKNPTRPSA